LRDWPPLASFRRWLYDELDRSLEALRKSAGQLPAPAKKPRRRR
jgi:hypothetical protein